MPPTVPATSIPTRTRRDRRRFGSRSRDTARSRTAPSRWSRGTPCSICPPRPLSEAPIDVAGSMSQGSTRRPRTSSRSSRHPSPTVRRRVRRRAARRPPIDSVPRPASRRHRDRHRRARMPGPISRDDAPLDDRAARPIDALDHAIETGPSTRRSNADDASHARPDRARRERARADRARADRARKPRSSPSLRAGGHRARDRRTRRGGGAGGDRAGTCPWSRSRPTTTSRPRTMASTRATTAPCGLHQGRPRLAGRRDPPPRRWPTTARSRCGAPTCGGRCATSSPGTTSPPRRSSTSPSARGLRDPVPRVGRRHERISRLLLRRRPDLRRRRLPAAPVARQPPALEARSPTRRWPTRPGCYGHHTIAVQCAATSSRPASTARVVHRASAAPLLDRARAGEPCRGDRLGVQAWSTTEVTVDRLRLAR